MSGSTSARPRSPRLGLAKASRQPVAVLCTSGTAAANFHPAVIEADESSVPLLVLTADRPPELRGIGANQAIDQIKLYGSAVRWFWEAGLPEARPGMVGYWRCWPARPGPTRRAAWVAWPARSTSTCPFASRWCPSAARSGPSRWTGAPAGSRGRVWRTRTRRGMNSRCRGPNVACWSAETATTTRRRWWSWPNRRAGRCSPSPPRAPAAGRTRCPPTSTCSRCRSSSAPTGPT